MAAALLGLTIASSPAGAQVQYPRVSPKATVSQTLGLTDLTVAYCRPGVKGRVIWGDLVPYDNPWRTGANESTTFTTTGEIQFGGQKLAAGTYSLFTIPGKDQWIVGLNSEKDIQWGGESTYNPDKDVLRVKAAPVQAAPREWMEFSFEDLTANSVNLVLSWEKLSVAVPITADVSTKVLANARAAMDTAKAGDWRTPYQAASYCFNFGAALDEGRGWLQKSLGVQENFQNLTLLARWQMKDGKKPEAIETARKAIAAGKASKDKVDTAQTEKLLADWTAAK
jgi:hypothetical protein